VAKTAAPTHRLAVKPKNARRTAAIRAQEKRPFAAVGKAAVGNTNDLTPFPSSGANTTIFRYVGHAETWDEMAVEGDIAAKDCLVRIRRAGQTLAVVSIFRDLKSLEAEVSLERDAMR
jgi:hypothetical protein